MKWRFWPIGVGTTHVIFVRPFVIVLLCRDIIQVSQYSTFQMVDWHIFWKKIGLQCIWGGLFATNPSRTKHGNGFGRCLFPFFPILIALSMIAAYLNFLVIIGFRLTAVGILVSTPIILPRQTFQVIGKFGKMLCFRIDGPVECANVNFISISCINEEDIRIGDAESIPLWGREILSFG